MPRQNKGQLTKKAERRTITLLYNYVIVRLNDMNKKKEVLKMPPKAKLSKEEIIETAF